MGKGDQNGKNGIEAFGKWQRGAHDISNIEMILIDGFFLY